MPSAEAITAIGAALVAVVGAVTAMMIALRPLAEILVELKKNRAELVKNTKVTEETHVMINSQHDAAVAQQTRTDNALRAAGVLIPYDPSANPQKSGTEQDPRA
jgi:hypothetical protein